MDTHHPPLPPLKLSQVRQKCAEAGDGDLELYLAAARALMSAHSRDPKSLEYRNAARWAYCAQWEFAEREHRQGVIPF